MNFTQFCNFFTVSALLAGLSLATVRADDSALGKRLHDARCLLCHGVENYEATRSKIKSLDDLRAMVRRWEEKTNFSYTGEERELVIAYLNTRFYKFVMPRKAG